MSIQRIDAPLKVAGAAPYASDVHYPGLAAAVLVPSTIAAGKIIAISTDAAEEAPGVLAVITHLNAPRLRKGPRILGSAQPPANLQHERISHHGQFVACVVAETAHEAQAAAALVEVAYEAEQPQVERSASPTSFPGSVMDVKRGDVVKGFASADVSVEATYTTPDHTHNPMGLFAVTAVWEGDRLTVHDCTQGPMNARKSLAGLFDLPLENVRVLAPYVGGAFGAGARVWPYEVIAAMAAMVVGRPVKLVLTRPQMFTASGHRPGTVQRLKIGATSDGQLTAILHESHLLAALEDTYVEPTGVAVGNAYDCPNVSTREKQTKGHLPSPTQMRGPGETQGNFAIESAMDELAIKLGMDPIDLRLRNDSGVHPHTGQPWSSRAIAECYQLGAERFGWARRSPQPRSMSADGQLVGYGMAGASFPYFQFGTTARATLRADGTAVVGSSAVELGQGAYTVMTQIAAEALTLPPGRVEFQLGTTDLPDGGSAGGSATTGALGEAVDGACAKLVAELLALAADSPESPLHGRTMDEITVSGGRIQRVYDPAEGETYAEILARAGLPELTVEHTTKFLPFQLAHLAGNVAVSRMGGLAKLGLRMTRQPMPCGASAAHFVEVRVDPDLGVVRVTRVVTVVDGGRVVNDTTARSQIMGAVIGGIGMALLEDTVTDPTTGRIVNATLADYLVPVNADVPDLDISFVGRPDPYLPLGVKGLGEIGLIGVAAAVANAVHHATGIRVRTLPITPDRLL